MPVCGGALFAFLRGSRATGAAGSGSDLDLAAFFGREAAAYDVVVPDGSTCWCSTPRRWSSRGGSRCTGSCCSTMRRPAGWRGRWASATCSVHGYAGVDDHRVVAQLQELAGAEEFVTATARLLC